jgi:hypothetical protein
VLVVVLVLVACAKPQADIPSAMTPTASPSIASPSIGDGAIELAAQAASTYGENHRDTFAGLYVDASQAQVVIRFTSDFARHQAALDALAGRQGLYIVRSATWTEDALLQILQALSDAQLELQQRGISVMEIGPNPYTNRLDVVAKSDLPNAAEILERYGPSGAISVKLHPADKSWSNVTIGDGWRLLGWFQAKQPYRVAVVTTREDMARELERQGITESFQSWNPSQEVVAFLGYAIGSSCTEVRLDGINIDLHRRLVYGEFSDPLAPRVCTADLKGSVTFLVALRRLNLPASPFRLRLQKDLLSCAPDCFFDEEEIVVDLR